jgi:hypothetical protein
MPGGVASGLDGDLQEGRAFGLDDHTLGNWVALSEQLQARRLNQVVCRANGGGVAVFRVRSLAAHDQCG